MTTALRRDPLRRTALAVAALALSAGTLSACGGDDTDASSAAAEVSESASESPSESPSEAPTESPSTESTESAAPAQTGQVKKFCSIYSDLVAEVGAAVSSTGGFATVLPKLRDLGQQLKAVGLVDDAPDDVKAGLDVNLKVVDDLPDDATQQDLFAAGGDVTADELSQAEAFSNYVASTCPDLAAQAEASPAS